MGYGGMAFWDTSNERAASLGEMAHVRAIILMAGVEAECLVGGPDNCGKHDLRQARQFASVCCRSEAAIDDFVDFARRSARRLLRAHVGALVALTVALVTKRSLDRAEIVRIIESAE